MNRDRREFLAAGLTAGALVALGPGRAAMAAPRTVSVDLEAAEARVPIAGAPYRKTAVWSYDGRVPGPLLRARQGDRLRVRVRNRLVEPTTVHWHGIRLPNAMDGVPHLTQAPIAPGKDFHYDFTLPDAGSYWYHPHINSSEQVGRGLAGALIVEEPNPPRVDREVVWVLGDWRLNRRAAIVDDFGHPHDLSHAGRIGNSVTINGRVPSAFAVRSGERIRLRLINVANARTFGLRFEGLQPQIVARDGQAVTPHAPEDAMVVLAAAQRVDLIVDMTGAPGARTRVVDAYYRRNAYRLIDLAYRKDAPLRSAPPDWPVAVAPNALPKPDLKAAVRHEVVLQGGAMSGMMRRRMGPGGGPAAMRRGAIWALNGRSMSEAAMKAPPLFTFKRGASVTIAMRNETVFEHPMHIHGHTFRVIARNGRAPARDEWLDTVLVRPRETVEIAFVADNPGDWMFHCHVQEHLIAGMMAVVRVA